MPAKKRPAKAAAKTSKPAAKKPKLVKPARPAKPKPAKATKPAKSSARADVAAQLLTDLPRLTDEDRAAFRAQFDDAQCDELGTRTKSDAVEREALAFAAAIDKALRAHPHALRRYGATRLAWFVECVRALGAARGEQRSAASKATSVGMDLDLARIAALSVRNDLRDTLSILAGADAKEKAAVHAAMGEKDDDRGVVDALRALADLAEQWLARGDAKAKTLVSSVSLGKSDVEAAISASEELAQAAAIDLSEGGTVATRDTPPVNRAEGRVLLEMRVAMGVFARAHEQNPQVPRLVPGPGTRGVLAGHAKKKAEPEAPVAPAATGG